MGVRNIPISLPDGQEDALIVEFATYEGWTAESGVTAGQYIKAKTAEMIKERIKRGRVAAAAAAATATKEQEVDALAIT